MKRLVWSACLWLAVAGFALAQEPVCEWSMFESGTAILNTGTDGESGNLTLAEGAELSDDVPTVNTGGHALRLGGGEPTAAAESAAFFDPLAGAEKFTVMAWVRRESVSSASNQSARIFADYDGSGGVEFYFGGAPGYIQFRVNDKQVWTTAGFITPNNYSWHHVAVVYDSTRPATNLATRNVHFYIDGIQKGDGSTMDDVPTPNAVCAAIGNTSTDRAASTLLVGSIDNVLVFRDWAPEPSGKGNLNTAIRDWMLLDDSTRAPDEEEEDEHIVPPVIVEDVIAQKIGPERQYEDLPEGTIFVDAESGELFFVNEENPHGRMVCTFKGLPDWHSFTNTVRLNGNRLDLNNYYSMMAESHALSVRYGTNTIWTAVGEEWGDLAGLTVSVADEHTLILSCNAVGDGVVLQVCTNLMEANPWRPATNMEVVAETDVATTWRVHLMMELSAPEFYRVLHNGPSVAAGFHIYPELHAHGGLEMGGVTWSNLPDTNSFLTAEADATALAALGTHTGNTNNPHSVTAAQVGALPMTWTNSAEVKSLTIGEGTCTNLAELASTGSVFAVSGRVSDIEADYVKSGDIADFATTGDVASVAERVSVLEYPVTCRLYWSDSYITNHWDAATQTIEIPTNFPTRKLFILASDTTITNLEIHLDATWIPDREVEISVYVSRGSTTASRHTDITVGKGLIAPSLTSATGYRLATATFDPLLGTYGWFSQTYTMPNPVYAFNTSNGNRVAQPSTWPSTVEGWCELLDANP